MKRYKREEIKIWQKNRDNSGLKNMGSGAEWEIKGDKGKGDTDTTDKQTDGHSEQSAVTLHLTVKPTEVNSSIHHPHKHTHTQSTILSFLHPCESSLSTPPRSTL